VGALDLKAVARVVVLAVLFAGCAAEDPPPRTPASVGATRMIDFDAFSAGYRRGVEALADHMQSELGLDPGEYYVSVMVERQSEDFTFTVWHQAAFEPKYATVANPGGRCFRITWDPDTDVFSPPQYW